MKNIIERFTRYAKIDTQSDPFSETIPSTQKQFNLSNMLYNELVEMGYKNVELNEMCYIYAEIPANNPNNKNLPKIGFVAHVDTSPDRSGENVKPQIVENYQGGDLQLGESNHIIKFSENKHLKDCIGHTIITTDGTTLLGSDDKSGVTAIMELAKYYAENPAIEHGAVGICFTPDEEIGRGADKFDLEKFGCEYAYTIDGEMPGEINKETFTADHAWIRCFGREIHPGSAKDIMVNSSRAIARAIELLPKDQAPETTEGHQQYIHPHTVKGNVGFSELMILLRTFIDKDLALQHDFLNKLVEQLKQEFPKTRIELEIKKVYRNMFDVLQENPKGCDYLFEAANRAGVNAEWKPIRGGTDGSRLTEMGLPCPNIFTGGQNFHSEQEWLSVNSLAKTIETMKNLVQVWYEKA